MFAKNPGFVTGLIGPRKEAAFGYIAECLKIARRGSKAALVQKEIQQYAKPLHTPEGRYAILKVAEQLIPDDIDDFSRRYESITMPVLIIWGDNDKIVPIDVGKKLHKTLVGSQFHVIRKCGHIPQEEKPEVTIHRIQSFLSGYH